MTTDIIPGEQNIWPCCMGCYNAGTLTGAWVDALYAPEDMDEFNDLIGFDDAALQHNLTLTRDDEPMMTDKRVVVSKDHGHPIYGPHDEIWVTDFEGFGGFLDGECSPSEAKRIAELIQAISEDGVDVNAVAAWVANGNDCKEWDRPTAGAFGDSYAGDWDNLAEFASNFLEDTGFFTVQMPYGDSIDLPDHIMQYQDAIEKAWLSDMEHCGSFWTADSTTGVYVFWN